MSEPFLKVRNIHKKFRIGNQDLNILKGVSFTMDQGEWVSLLGASGSGKTTLLDIIGMISTPDQGEIVIDGINTADLTSRSFVDFRRDNIGFVFQAYHILPELNILENVMLPMMFAGDAPKEKCRKRAEELLCMTGLKDRMNHRPNELSGGEQQRAAIARALINEPTLLLADEPTGNLDPNTGESILEIFRQIRKEHNTTILMVTHDSHIAHLSDRMILMKNGQVTNKEENQTIFI